MSIDERKPRSELRHWSTYATVTEWYKDYRGYVPTQMAQALDQLIRKTGMSFPDAYRQLLERGAIIHLDPADDIESDDAGANSERPMDSREVLIVGPASTSRNPRQALPSPDQARPEPHRASFRPGPGDARCPRVGPSQR